jgi:hypothetical protein
LSLDEVRVFLEANRNRFFRWLLALLLALAIAAQVIPALGDYISHHKLLGGTIFLAVTFILFETITSPNPQSGTSDDSVVLSHYSDMKPALHRAFEAGVVELDIAGYSGETFYSLLSEFFAEAL